MPRPKTPLIEPKTVVRRALEMLDAGAGNDLSIRALARDLGVQSSSLYHHFKEKSEIEEAVCRLVLSMIRMPAGREMSWKEEMIEYGKRYRAALMAHPNVIPLLQTTQPLKFGTRMYEYSLQRLHHAGFTLKDALALIMECEALAFGSAALASRSFKMKADEIDGQFTNVREALLASLDGDSEFERAYVAITDAFAAKCAVPA